MPLTVVCFTPDAAVSVIPTMLLTISTFGVTASVSTSRGRSKRLPRNTKVRPFSSGFDLPQIRHKFSGAIRLVRENVTISAVAADVVPRPGIEPGLEVPETSVMSFSLPGQSLADLINISGFGAGQARPRQMRMRYGTAPACASRGGAHRKKAPFDVAKVQTGDDRGRD